MKEKYILKKILEEIKEDEQVFGDKPNYWATQEEIDRLRRKVRLNNRKKDGD